MTRIKILPLILTLAALLLLAVPASAQNEGVIQGQLTNGTPGGAAVSKVPVTLRVFAGESEQASKETVSDQDGKFQLSGLATGSNYSYQLVVTYQEAEYDSDTITFEADETTQSVAMTVYDATDKADNISFHASQMEVYLGQGRLEIVERYLVTNSGDKTYIGSQAIPGDGRKSTLFFNMPREADLESLQVGGSLMDCCRVFGNGGVHDTMAVIPGDKVLVFSYQVPYSSSEYTLTKTFVFPIVNFAVLVEDKGVKVSSSSLAGGQSVQFNGVNYLQFIAKDIAAGAPVAFTLSGLAQAGGQTLKWIGIAAAIVVLGVGLGYPLSRRRKVAVAVEGRAARSSERSELLLRLAKLDDDYEAGRLGEAEYKARRARLKQRLLEMSRQAGRQSKA